jgi:toxin ParE1/3/4
MAGSGRLVWSPEAETDLVAIWRWGADNWSEELSDRHLFEIELACERLLDNPLFGKARNDLLPGVRSVPAAPHIIFYRPSARDPSIRNDAPKGKLILWRHHLLQIGPQAFAKFIVRVDNDRFFGKPGLP